VTKTFYENQHQLMKSAYVMFSDNSTLMTSTRWLWEMCECKQRKISAQLEKMIEKSIKNFPASKAALKPIN